MKGVAVDPLAEMLAQEAREDHAKAKGRGERILRCADAAVNGMLAEGRLSSVLADDARIAIVRAIADEFYGNAAIDMPTVRRSS